MSESDKAIEAFVATREPGEADWYLKPNSGMSPYQQRQLAQLTTGSEYAACRGKRGAPEGTLCKCDMRKREAAVAPRVRCRYLYWRAHCTGATTIVDAGARPQQWTPGKPEPLSWRGR